MAAINSSITSKPISSSNGLQSKKEVDVENVSNTQRVVSIVNQLTSTMRNAIGEIRDINENTKLLALNARIEAARSGRSGAAFGVVAQEMQNLSAKTAIVADGMATKTNESIQELISVISGNVRGTRLADLALTCVDLIDRNLYERTCDVRWWATDSSLVDCLTSRSPEAIEHASTRMRVILGAYTVYYDLVLADMQGNVIANGRPDLYKSNNRNECRSTWFQRASSTRTGEEFGFQSAHRSGLVNDQVSLIYSAAVREDGLSTGRPLGVLGVIFNWASFSQAILGNIPLDAVEKESTLGLIVDNQGTVIASSRPISADYRYPIEKYEDLLHKDKSFKLEKLDGKDVCIAHGKAPGFETYSTEWHAFLIQEI